MLRPIAAAFSISGSSFTSAAASRIRSGVWAVLLCLLCSGAVAQGCIDSLRNAYRKTPQDSSRALALYYITMWHAFNASDSTPVYVTDLTNFSQKIHFPIGQFLAADCLFFYANVRANYREALQIQLANLTLAQTMSEPDRSYFLGLTHSRLGLVKLEMDLQNQAIEEYRLCQEVLDKAHLEYGDSWGIWFYRSGRLLRLGQIDSAIWYARLACQTVRHSRYTLPYLNLPLANLGNCYRARGMNDSAILTYRLGLEDANYWGNTYIKARLRWNIAQYYLGIQVPDSSISYGRAALAICIPKGFGDYAASAAETIARAFEMEKNSDSALKYFKVMKTAKDSIFSQTKSQQFQYLIFQDQERQKELQQAKDRYNQDLRLYGLVLILAGFLLLVAAQWRNNRRMRRAYTIIQEQKQQAEGQKARIEQALQELQLTQSQLIQSEKMASLGELTAGIAHEIQNPLNFILNFSEVSKELAQEWQDEGLTKSERHALQQAIELNLEKVISHGRRAESIVRGMLQHSRSSTGQREWVDLQAMAEEFLHLSYQGFRSRDKEFHASIKTDFDPQAPPVFGVVQDLGRVLLNLFNNAFYAVAEHSKTAGSGYLPEVSVGIHLQGAFVRIWVRDNGTGISEATQQKIFQPFFTTKPPGSGTGLGLSLSYEIIQAHGGRIEVQSIPGVGSTFIIELPAEGPAPAKPAVNSPS